MLSILTSKIGSIFDELLGNHPARVGEEVPANKLEVIEPDSSDEDSSEEVFEELVCLLPGIDEEPLHIRVIETKIHSAQNKKNQGNQKRIAKNKKTSKKSKKNRPDELPDNESLDEKDDARSDLSASGCYNIMTKKVRLQLMSKKKLKPIAQRLSYQGNKQPKSLVRDITDANFKSPKLRWLEIDINEVDRHVFYKTFTLNYKYQLVGQKEEASDSQQSCFESKLQFEVQLRLQLEVHLRNHLILLRFQIPQLTEATPIKFSVLAHFRPEQRIVDLFQCDFKPINEPMENFLMEIELVDFEGSVKTSNTLFIQ